MSNLLNNEIQRMQVLAGLAPDKYRFEVFLEQKSHLTLKEILLQLNEAEEDTGEEAADIGIIYLIKKKMLLVS